MWVGGKYKKRAGRTVVSQRKTNYNNPKIIKGNYRSEKPKTKIKITRKGIENISLFVGFIVLLYFIFFSSYLKIKDVYVEGAKTLNAEEIKQMAPIGKNIFLFDTDNAKRKSLEQFPQIKNIAFFKGLPNAIKIQIVERESRLIWQTNSRRYLIDPEGKIAREILPDEQVILPLINDNKNRTVSVNDQIIMPEFIEFINFMNDRFQEFTNLKITSFEINETSYDLTINTDKGIKVFVDSTRGAEGQLRNLQQILVNFQDGAKEYVDLRVEGWGYYK